MLLARAGFSVLGVWVLRYVDVRSLRLSLLVFLSLPFSLIGGGVGGNVPGHEIEYPMAWVILGGLLSSTALNLFCRPALDARFGNVRCRHEEG